MTTDRKALSLHVEPHPGAVSLDGDVSLHGAIKWSLDLPVGSNLQPGERLTVVVCDADGQVLSQAQGQVEQPSFPPIKVRGRTIGMVRKHHVKTIDLTEEEG